MVQTSNGDDALESKLYQDERCKAIEEVTGKLGDNRQGIPREEFESRFIAEIRICTSRTHLNDTEQPEEIRDLKSR
jgi:hypothetical protein